MLISIGQTALALMAASPVASSGGEASNGPLSIDQSVAAFRLADPDLKIEPVAFEPAVADPVDVAWDADGAMYVVEMTDYPAAASSGRVKRLEDRDGDGRYESVSVFADGFAFPTSVLPWNGGILVTAAPDIVYLKDTDGDRVADQRRVVRTGFGEGNQQLRVNGLTWGIDNWIYGANGRSDGNVRAPNASEDEAVSIRRRDFRFRPTTGEFEAIAGFSQFGLTFDDWGNRFLSWNTIPIRHVVIEDRYLTRNPHLAAVSPAEPIADPNDAGRVFPISPPQRRFNSESVEFFNASCGLTVFRGDALGDAFCGDAFVCEPLTSLVHRMALVPDGASFVARRREQGREFLASTDPWFRPVNLATGPDGALYVVDFCREWVEHPAFVPQHLRNTVDFRVGSESGRIWRITRAGGKSSDHERPRLSSCSDSQLVKHLEHANGWWRDQAQRLLVERGGLHPIPALKELVRRGKSPQSRLHALWTLESLGGLDADLLIDVLKDGSGQLRATGLRLSEPSLMRSPRLAEAALRLVGDSDPQVRLQLAASIGFLESAAKRDAAVELLVAGDPDEWMRLALFSSIAEEESHVLSAVIQRDVDWLMAPSQEHMDCLAELTEIVGRRNHDPEIRACLAALRGRLEGKIGPGHVAVLAGLTAGIERSGRPLQAVFAQTRPSENEWGRFHRNIMEYARRQALAESAPLTLRVSAVQLVARMDSGDDGRLFLTLLDAHQPSRIQAVAADSIGRSAERSVLTAALDRWPAMTLATRQRLATAMIATTASAIVLVEALEDGGVVPQELAPSTRDALAHIADEQLRTRIASSLNRYAHVDRKEVIETYRPALALAGDRRRGAAHFRKNCMICHRVQGVGTYLGPDLAGVASRPAERLLVDILDPSREVAPDAVRYTLLTIDGRIITGALVAETATSVQIRQAQDVTLTILRSEIEQLRGSAKSVMPEGLDAGMTVQDLADVLAFLQSPDRSLLAK